MDKLFRECLLCNNTDIVELLTYEKDYLHKCSSCGFVFAKKIPTQEELVAEYYKYERGFTLSPITVKRYNETVDDFEIYRKENNVLDVGAGDGHFIEIAKKRGWNAYATEFDDKAVKVIEEKGVNVIQGKLDISNYKSNMFDVIFWSEVIEHINDPVEEVKKFHYLLREGGIVHVTTPNFNSISHKYLGNKWTVFNYPEHLSYYTPKTIKFLFNSNGFHTKSVKTEGFSPDRFFVSQGKEIGNISTEELRRKSENKLIWKGIKYTANNIFKLLGIGDTIKGRFIKADKLFI
jgi:2-polyprenyl-3-methyl-5-hydroxy-6-metoxy-1,4-benzoquinol methylase